MNEAHSSVAAVIRLDRLTGALSQIGASNYGGAGGPDFPLFKRVLTKAKSVVEGWGGKLYFVYMADMFHLQYRGARPHQNREPVLAAAKEVGLPIIDAHPTFLAVEDLSTIWFHPESHCNKAGYKLLADVILKGVEGS